MRGFVLGLFLIIAASVTILAMRPGGLRRQLSLAARRFRIFLALGGLYLVGSGAIRLVFPSGPFSDYGPAGLALVLVVVFLLIARDPAGTDTRSRTGA